MSTRANIHFVGIWSDKESIRSNIYRHSDGYPSGLGADLHTFLDEVDKLQDKRFGDPEYLAAKFLVWQADLYRDNYEGGKKSLLDFLSVSPCIEDHGDIEYRYKVLCPDTNDRPKIYVQKDDGKQWKLIKNAKAANTLKL